ncbi:MAG TPA: VacJ family lipoprotein [Aliidongia sp.]|uniref:MlaA family lipoprotein n=1 Tax=Aliidongia sp. TaxID=1914230 RepID=UPI002DDCEAA7|nr:VacJ family lipoprotein [Aliidongia sp.]HEV2676658.1 VacJ family lipoprotein [Aliidongia sp.]
MLSAMLLASCASAPPGPSDAADDTNDPYESVNRVIFDVNMSIDKYFFEPVAEGYRWVLPTVVRTGISNVLRNLKGPLIMANDLLEGNPQRFGDTFGRFMMNTFFGLGGLIDVGTDAKIPYHDADFGMTLAVWGVGSGPYLVLPLLNSSNPRDGIAYGLESYADPVSIELRAHDMGEGNYVRLGVGLISERANHIEDIDELKRSSLDFYATVRSLYWQSRNADIEAAKSPSNPAQPKSVSYDPGPAPTATPTASQTTPATTTADGKAKAD